MNKIDLNPIFLKIFLYILILIVPLTIVLRSLTINLNLILISLIILYYFLLKKNLFIFKEELIRYLCLFLFYVLFNSVYNFNNLEIFVKSVGNFRYIILTIAVFFVLNTLSENKKNLFIYINFIFIILIGLDIIYQFIFYQNIFGFKPGMCDENLENCQRFAGIFNDELIAGGFISQIGLLVFFLLETIKIKNNRLKFFIKFIFGIFLFIVILITGERNALLIFYLALFFYFFFNKKIIYFVTLNIFLILFMILIGQFSNSIKARYLEISDVSWTNESQLFTETLKRNITNSPWSYHYQAAFELFLQKPITGHGPKSFRNKCKDTKIEKRLIKDYDLYFGYKSCSTHPHSYMMEFLSEYGIIGFLFFIILFIKIFLKLFKFRNQSNQKNIILLIGTGSILLAIIFPFKPSGSFFSTFNATVFFYIFGFFLHYLKQNK